MRPPPAPPKFATHVEDRLPKFKMHNTLAHARLAVNMRDPYAYKRVRGGTIYEWGGADWVIVEQVKPKARP